MTKEIHIVFQVLNYLVSEQSAQHKLLPIDKFILIILAKHHGARGIFPNQETIAREIQSSLRYTKTRIKHLENSGLISIKRLNRKNHYILDFLETMGDLQVTSSYPQQETIGDLQITSQGIYRSPHRGSTDHTNNKEEEPKKKTERARTNRAAPLSDDFLPTDDTVQKAKELGLTEDEANDEFDKFLNYYIENGQEKADWNLVLHNWFIRAAAYKAKKPVSKPSLAAVSGEVKSTVPWYKPDPLKAFDILKHGGLNGLGAEKK